MKAEQSREFSQKEFEVNKLIADTLNDVSKLDLDVKKLPSRGVLQLNYEPDDVPNRQQKEIRRDIQKLKAVVEDLKTNALFKTDELIAQLPSEQQIIIRQMAVDKLYPNKSRQDKILPMKEKNIPEGKNNSFESLQADKAMPIENRFSFLSRFTEVKNIKDEKTETQPPELHSQKQRFSNFLQYQPGRNDNKEKSLNRDDR